MLRLIGVWWRRPAACGGLRVVSSWLRVVLVAAAYLTFTATLTVARRGTRCVWVCGCELGGVQVLQESAQDRGVMEEQVLLPLYAPLTYSMRP